MANKYELRRRALKEARGRSDNPFASPRHGGAIERREYTPPPPVDRWGTTAALSLGLVVLITALYAQTAGHKFTVCDDNVYIYANPRIQSGLTQHLTELKNHFIHGEPEKLSDMPGNAVVWAFADAHEGNWHPLTWLSHMLDWELFSHGTWDPQAHVYKDSWPGGHHLVSMGIHCVNAVLLFLALRLLTGTLWPSFVVAALFGVHPLRVESVAWAAERKDVLCGLFWMASMLAYAGYARRRLIRSTSFPTAVWIAIFMGMMFILLVLMLFVLPDVKVMTYLAMVAVLIGIAVAGMLIDTSVDSPSWMARLAEIGSYLLVTLFLPLGLMSKSMIVTLPCVFILLDIWPLRRWERAEWPPGRRQGGRDMGAMIWLVAEKIPWFAMVLGDGYITVYGQNKGVALNSFEGLPMGVRLLNAVESCGEYLRQAVWPTGLAPFYAHPHMIPDGWTREFFLKFGISCALLAAITFSAIWFFRQRPFLVVGWFWFLGTLMPVIGIIQVGTQARADRYTYLPMIGVYLMVAWLLMEVAQRWPKTRLALAAGSVVVLIALSAVTFRQVGYWVDSYKLFEHAVQVTDRNYFGYNHIGIAYDSDAKNITTMDANEAEELFDHLAKDFNRKSWRISARGASGELLDHLPEDFHGPPKNLDKSLRHLLAYADSAEDFKEAARKLSLLQKQQLLFDYSADAFEATLIIKPDYDFGNNNLGVYFARKSSKDDLEAAEKYFTNALKYNQRYADAYNNNGIILVREGTELLAKGMIPEAEKKFDDAIACHKQGLGVRDDRASDHNNLCRAYMARSDLRFKQGDLKHANADLDNALNETSYALLKCDPNFLGAWINRAQIYVKQKKLDEAVDCVRRMIAIAPKAPETFSAQLTIAKHCVDANQPDKAIELLNPILEINNSAVEVYFLRALAYLQKGDLIHAKEDLGHIPPQLRETPQFREALEKLREAEEHHPQK